MIDAVVRPEPARTYLYVPGDRPDRFGKAVASGADAVILDLEDGVDPRNQDDALAHVHAEPRTAGTQWWVRITPERLSESIAAAVTTGTTGVFVPAAEPELLADVARLLDERERVTGAAPLVVVALVETARGVQAVADLATSPRVYRMGLGEADLAAALGLAPSEDRRELWAIRSDLVVASAAAGLEHPVGPVQTDIEDHELLARSTRQLVRQGFSARTVIHPRHVEMVHEHLAPAPDEVGAAQSVLSAFEAAHATGAAVGRDSLGRLVDPALVRSARAVLARAQAPGRHR